MATVTYAQLAQSLRNSDNIELFEEAQTQGFDFNTKELFDSNLLMKACAYGRSQSVKFLLDHGVDPNVIDFFNCSALIIAASSDVECIQLLLSAGANLSYSQKTWTPLMRASLAGRLDCVQCLLDAGINPSSVYRDGRTASMIARDKGHIAVAEFIENYSNEPVKSALEIEEY